MFKIKNNNDNIINIDDINEITEDQKKYNKLKASKENIVFVNFLKNRYYNIEPFGINDLFQKIHDFFKESDDYKNSLEKLNEKTIERKASQLREQAKDVLLANKVWGGIVGILPGVDMILQKFVIKKNAMKKVGKIFGIDIKFVEENRKNINKEKDKKNNEINNEIKDEIKIEEKDEIKIEEKDEKKDEIIIEEKDEIKIKEKDEKKNEIIIEEKDEIKDIQNGILKDEIKDKQKDILKDEIKDIEIDIQKEVKKDEIKDKKKYVFKDEIKDRESNIKKDKKKDEIKKKQKKKLKEEKNDEEDIFSDPNIDKTILKQIKEKDLTKESIKTKICKGIKFTSETGAYVGSGCSIANIIGLGAYGIGLGAVGVVVGIGLGGYITHKYCENLIEKFVIYYKENAEIINNSYKKALEYFDPNEDEDEVEDLNYQSFEIIQDV